MPLAFAPIDWVVLVFLAPAVLFYIAAVAPLRRALQAAFAFGLGQFGVGVSWVFVSINEYGGGGWLVAGLVTVGFVLLLALFPLLAVALGRWAGRARTLPTLLLTLPAAWVLVEWVRTWLFTGFPWLFLGYAALDTPLAGLAPLVGVLGTSFVVALLAGLIACSVRWPSWLSLGGVVVGCSIAVLIGVAADRPWSELAPPPAATANDSTATADDGLLRVALLQGNYPQDIKWQPAYREVIRRGYAQMTWAHLGADLIVWPETALPELYEQVAPNFLEPLAQRVRQAGGLLITGIPYREPGVADAPLYNSVAVFGDETSFYRKRHLVPYGEYVPFRDLFGRSLDFLGAPMADYRRGPVPEAIPATDALRLGVTICYEAAYPRAVARGAKGAHLLVNVSNDAWFGDSLAPHQHLQKARQRAAETRRWMLRATNTGISAVIDPYGRVVAVGPQFIATSVVADVELRSGQTPYVTYGDIPLLMVLAAVLGGVALLAHRRSGAGVDAAEEKR
ncbi:apolipoprotein N-acyltransferase [Halorhodospira abdelmalekii]|nr:apolipoprotein N-acyltransferase [Halorhodospira abdelmalekii]MBK1736016.1 apolipoprotein N-acyltransferase [Halorhodospira abdelmalekii]